MQEDNKPITIGSQTKVDFPKFGIKGVPAKVDTGADSSSLWASKIRERAGKLSFTLFAEDSPYYTGEVITTKDYKLRLVKNSFGHTEFRYKVLVNMKVEGRIIKVRFTLSNRSENRFPVLIGRRTLHGRFLVDVSRSNKKKYEVLVIRSSNLASTKASEKFFSELRRTKKNVNFKFISLEDLEFLIDESGIKVQIAKSAQDIAEFDLVYFRVILKNQDLAAATAQYLHYKGVPFTDRAILFYHQSVNKLHQQIVLKNAGVNVPKAMYVSREKISGSYKRFVQQLGSPFILKDIDGQKSRNNFLISNKVNFEKAVGRAEDRSLNMIAQQFIQHDGHYRVLIFGKRIEVIIHLIHRLAESRLGDKSKSGSATLVDEQKLPGSVKRMAIKAAEVTKIDLAGVDIMRDNKLGVWYCLEVNENPQLVTGAFLDSKRFAFSEYLSNQI